MHQCSVLQNEFVLGWTGCTLLGSLGRLSLPRESELVLAQPLGVFSGPWRFAQLHLEAVIRGKPPYAIQMGLAWATPCLCSVVKRWMYDITEAPGTPSATCQRTLCALCNHPEDERRSSPSWAQADGAAGGRRWGKRGMDTEPGLAKGLGGLRASASRLCLACAQQSLAWESMRPQPDLSGMWALPSADTLGCKRHRAPSSFPRPPAEPSTWESCYSFLLEKITLIFSTSSLAFITVWCPSASFILKALFIFNKS